ncbi:Aminopeptidase [hydrothermal vent metagenome]|uniref:Aminopeptidase n=1 Tax=hydrothermal vent metagenome TaxID=652676 RepID=A0A3B0TT29_9ZZZZ
MRLGHDNPQEEEEDWTYASDHFEFHQRNIPYIYFGVENHVDYHKPTDTVDKINTNFYTEAVKVIIQSIENIDLNN